MLLMRMAGPVAEAGPRGGPFNFEDSRCNDFDHVRSILTPAYLRRSLHGQ